jgi:hypothetical protein
MTDDSLRRSDNPRPRRTSSAAQRTFEIEFFEAVLRRNPCLVEAVRVHAHNLAAARLDSRALFWDCRHARLRPDDPIPHYNIACMLARLGQIDEAFAALDRAIRLGYPLRRRILRDPDLRPLRDDPRYPALVRRLVRGRSE